MGKVNERINSFENKLNDFERRLVTVENDVSKLKKLKLFLEKEIVPAVKVLIEHASSESSFTEIEIIKKRVKTFQTRIDRQLLKAA